MEERWSQSFNESVVESEELKSLVSKNLSYQLDDSFMENNIYDSIDPESEGYNGTYHGTICKIKYWVLDRTDSRTFFGGQNATVIKMFRYDELKLQNSIELEVANPGETKESNVIVAKLDTGTEIGIEFTVAIIRFV